MGDYIGMKILSALSVFGAWVFAQASKIDPIISQAFDQLFSLGLLVVVLVVLWKEYKAGKKQNDDRDKEFTELLRDNIKTRQQFQESINALAKAIDKLSK